MRICIFVAKKEAQKLVEYYSKYHNSYVKHNDIVIEEEIEFILELTSSFMKHLVRLSNLHIRTCQD